MEEKQGAEATVKINGKVVKRRNKKEYRHSELDQKIRQERTEQEQKLMEEARRYNVNVPEVKKKDDNTLEIEKIEGEKLREKIQNKPELAEKLGENIVYLHSEDIIHGDLTTSNAIVEKETGKVYMIDFGLSFRSERFEDKAVDIHLLKQVLNSSHPEAAEKAWQKFLNGYQKYKKSEEILEQLEEVENRGRYK